MKPPQQPHAIHPSEVLERLFVPAPRQQIEHVGLLGSRARLVPGLELHLLPRVKKPNRLERESWIQAAIECYAGAEVHRAVRWAIYEVAHGTHGTRGRLPNLSSMSESPVWNYTAVECADPTFVD